ncbi:MAG: hypothetical protein IPH20_07385 [Bacteroidales bacterium]|nr:hypothetical protein [Bacteroidales bacterium]
MFCLEVLVIPGTTVVGIAGFALIVFAVWEGYHVFGSPIGHFIMTGTVFLTILADGAGFKPTHGTS